MDGVRNLTGPTRQFAEGRKKRKPVVDRPGKDQAILKIDTTTKPLHEDAKSA